MMTINMIMLRKIGYTSISFILLSYLSGCVTLNESKPDKIDVSDYSNLTTVDAVKKLESNLKNSAANDLATFAPKHYSTADKALIEARSLISKNESREQIVQKVAVATAVLRNGDMVMRKVKDVLEDQLIIKEKLDSLQTKKVYRSEYGSLEERLNNIIREIENGELTKNKQNRIKLLQDLQKLERRSIRYNAMHEPEEILKRVKYRGGQKLAPLTYQDAQAVFLRAEEFIINNPNYETGIDQIGQEALFAAKRALYITEQVASLSQKVSISLEQVILDEEYRLYRVARELNNIDLRDNPLEMQSEQLAKIAKNKAEEYKNKEDLIIALRDTLIEVRDSSAELTALNDTSIRLKKEKGEWLAKEALYKAKVSHLENTLNLSQVQLDQTQQKLLAMQVKNEQKMQAEQKAKLGKAGIGAFAVQEAGKDKKLTPQSSQAQTSPAIKGENTNFEKNEPQAPAPVAVETDTTVKQPAQQTADGDSTNNTITEEAKIEVVNKNQISEQESKQATIKNNNIAAEPKTASSEKKQPPVVVSGNEKSKKPFTSPNNQPKSQITEKETMDALNSVMELISSNSKETKSNVFVDASD